MPNWADGVLKIRGKKENIIRFAKECITGINGWKVQNIDTTNATYELGKNEDFNVVLTDDILIIKGTMDTHIEGTRRMFIQDKKIEWWFKDTDVEIFTVSVQQAWGISAKNLQDLSKKYDLDFRIYAFEKGMEFNQEIEVIKGEITINREIEFDDYNWECINPKLGG